MSVAGIPLRLVSKCLFVPLESGVVISERSGPADGSVVGGMACRFETGETFLSLVIVVFSFFDGASTAAPLKGGLEIHMYNGSTRHFKEQPDPFNTASSICLFALWSRTWRIGLGRICDSINNNTSGLDEWVSSLRLRGFSIWSV
jgi:hypothetical protein